MAKIGLFFGSNQGATEGVAHKIKEEFDKYAQDSVQIYNIGTSSVDDIRKWDLIIFGISTWDIGQLQDDWALFLPNLDDIDFTGKKVALFGLGDQFGYPGSFIDAVGVLGDKVLEKGGDIDGGWPVAGYEVEYSVAQIEEFFFGLAIDEDNETEKTAERVSTWVKDLAGTWGIS